MPDIIGDTIGGLVQDITDVPKHLFSGDIGGLFGDALKIGPSLVSPGTGSFLGDLAGNAALGAGSSLVSGLFSGGNTDNRSPDATSPGPTAPTPFNASREADNSLPGSLSQFAGFDPDQQASNIATQGVYGGGNGPEENSYFANLINHKLVGNEGQVGGDLSPIEKTYSQQLGLGDGSDPMSLLEAISKKRSSGAAFGGFA